MFEVLRNAGWISVRIGAKAAGMIITMFLLVRYLGPAQFGSYALVIAIQKFVEASQAWSAPNLLVRDIAADSDHNATASKIMSVAILGSLLSVGLWLLIVLFLYFFVGRISSDFTRAIVVTTAGCVFSAANSFQAYFLSRLNSRPLAILETITNIFGTACTVIAIILKAPLIWFFWIVPITSLLNLFLSYYEYKKAIGPTQTDINWKYGYHLTLENFPLVISSLSIMVYTKIDQLMLGIFSTTWELGEYAAMVRIAEGTNIIASVVHPAALPKLTKIYEQQRDQYGKYLERVYSVMLGAWLVLAVPIWMFHTSIVQFLYGDKFHLASNMLPVYIWAQFATAVGMCRSLYMVNNKLIRLAVPITVTGAVINVLSNLLLIPKYGAWGATWATLITYGATCIGLTFLIPKLRPIAIMPLTALNFWRTFKLPAR